jgi:small-conductance mechanosensitive channel/CRP-like cAMP-binding protein
MPTSPDWTFWALLLLVAFPVLVIVTGEVLNRMREREAASAYLTPLSIVRNGVLPLAFIDGMLRIVMGLTGGHLAVKIADTGLWIVVLNAAVAFLNILLFGEDARLAGRVRLPRLLLDLARLVLVLCGAAVVVSQVWGVDLSGLITALGVGSIVIGLALQDTLGSIFSGIALVSARQIHVGDWIRYGSDEGLVLAMNWRAVKVRTSAGDVLYVPNGVISKQAVRVLTLGTDTTTLNASVRFPYGRSPDTITALMNEVARATPGFHLDPPPAAWVNAFDDSVEYVIAVRATDPRRLSAVRGEYLTNLWFAVQRRGLSFNGALKSPDNAPRAAKQPPEAIVEMLTRVAAFRLDADALRQLAEHARLEQYRAGQTVLAQGAVAGDVYVLTAGRATAVVAAGDGPEMTLHSFEPGQTMMAKSLFQGRGTPYTIRAATELDVVAIPLHDFKEVCLADFALAREIEQILTAREEAAVRVRAKAAPDGGEVGLNDRMQLMREMFQS